MRRKGISYPLLIVILGIALLGYYLTSHPLQASGGAGGEDTPQTSLNQSVGNGTTKITFFNVQVFGVSKASDPTVMKKLKEILSSSDISFIQEIRDSTNTSFQKLCLTLPDYNCAIGARKGRSSSKEQIGVVFKKSIQIKNIVESYDYNLWERPPTTFGMFFNDKTFYITVLHSKPDDAASEVSALEDYVESTFSGNLIVGGDENMDCSYYNENSNVDFTGWRWVIPNSEDTTVASSSCTYDRIFMNNQSTTYYQAYEIYRNLTDDVSDHFPVSVFIS